MYMAFRGDEPTQTYKGYRNDKFQKHTVKLKNQLWQIRDSSLKPDDKEKLKQELIKTITEFKITL